MRKIAWLAGAVLFLSAPAFAQEFSTDLARHDLFYSGAQIDIRLTRLQNGEITWDYINERGWGEVSDAILLDDGNILVASMFNIFEVNPDKQIVWHYDIPLRREVHTIQPIGKDRVVFVENAKPYARVVVLNVVTKEREREFEVPVRFGASAHGQFRCCRLTPRGTLLVANTTLGKITEYNADGETVSEWEVPSPWDVKELANGHILFTSNAGFVREFDRSTGETVWEIRMRDIPGFRMTSLQRAWRLPDGNTIIGNWYNSWSSRDFAKFNPANPPAQAIEVTPEGKVVWVLRAWTDPVNLGPSSNIQPLNEPVKRGECYFGDFR